MSNQSIIHLKINNKITLSKYQQGRQRKKYNLQSFLKTLRYITTQTGA